MRRRPGKSEFVSGLLDRLSASDETKEFHTSVFRDAFKGVRARFRYSK